MRMPCLIRRPSIAERLAHRRDHRLLIRELAGLELRVQPLSSHRELKTPTLGGNHYEAADRLLVLWQELGRQTDGLGLVISKSAVFQRYFHLRNFSFSTNTWFP